MTRFSSLNALMIVCLVFMLAACGAQQTRPEADSDTSMLNPTEISISEYREFLTELDAAITQGELREFNDRDLADFAEVRQSLDRLLARYDSVESMNGDAQARLFNLHARLEKVVVGRDETQVLCRRRHKVGTNFKVTECKSVDEWRSEQEWAQRHLRSIMYSDAGRKDIP
ncbi:MAG: hypothetical protein HND55_15230 [Pseudomonadota bacterium]|nr:MAG: hypothetical protein HND55_15230 [Pseudomonadota bacterium]